MGKAGTVLLIVFCSILALAVVCAKIYQIGTRSIAEDGKRLASYRDSVSITPGWKWVVDGNYSYVRGRFKNESNRALRYVTIRAEYLNDYSQVLDTDKTIESAYIASGASQSFEIMHRDAPDLKHVRLIVEEAIPSKRSER